MPYNILNYLKKADVFTFINLLLGLLSCSFVLKGNLEMAARLIVAATVADGFDGYFARKTNTSSDFGMNLDSLSDVVSFGLAPSFLLYAQNPQYWVVAFSFLFLASGVMRLARYNVLHSSLPEGQYVGIPIPNAAFFLTMALLSGFPHAFSLAVALCASLLMVSTVIIKKPEGGGGFPFVNFVLLLPVFTPHPYLAALAKFALVVYVVLVVRYYVKGKS